MENLGSEEDLGWDHGVLIWQEELSTEQAAFVGGLSGASDLDKEVAWVVLAGLSVDSDNYNSRNISASHVSQSNDIQSLLIIVKLIESDAYLGL